MTKPIIILPIDQSTDVTGVSILRCTPGSNAVPELLRYAAFDASHIEKGKHTKNARRKRIAWTAQQLSTFLDSCPWQIDVCAYEIDSGRGYAPTEALGWAAGAYLILPRLLDADSFGIMRQAACIAAGCHNIYRQPKGKTSAEQTAKRARLKAAVHDWAHSVFQFSTGDPFAEDAECTPWLCEAISDSLSIGMAAWKRWQDDEAAAKAKAAQKALFGKGSRPRKVPT